MPSAKNLSGILISGEERASERIRDIFKNNNISVLMAKGTVYELASKISDIKPKMIISDKKNIKSLKELAEKYIDINALYETLNSGQNIRKYKLITRIKLFIVKFLKKMKIVLNKSWTRNSRTM